MAHCLKHWLLFQRTLVQFPAPIWWLTSVCNSSSSGSNSLTQTCMQDKHQYIKLKKKKNKKTTLDNDRFIKNTYTSLVQFLCQLLLYCYSADWVKCLTSSQLARGPFICSSLACRASLVHTTAHWRIAGLCSPWLVAKAQAQSWRWGFLFVLLASLWAPRSY